MRLISIVVVTMIATVPRAFAQQIWDEAAAQESLSRISRQLGQSSSKSVFGVWSLADGTTVRANTALAGPLVQSLVGTSSGNRPLKWVLVAGGAGLMAGGYYYGFKYAQREREAASRGNVSEVFDEDKREKAIGGSMMLGGLLLMLWGAMR